MNKYFLSTLTTRTIHTLFPSPDKCKLEKRFKIWSKRIIKSQRSKQFSTLMNDAKHKNMNDAKHANMSYHFANNLWENKETKLWMDKLCTHIFQTDRSKKFIKNRTCFYLCYIFALSEIKLSRIAFILRNFTSSLDVHLSHLHPGTQQQSHNFCMVIYIDIWPQRPCRKIEKRSLCLCSHVIISNPQTISTGENAPQAVLCSR